MQLKSLTVLVTQVCAEFDVVQFFRSRTFRQWWSQMFSMKVFLKYAFHEHLVARNSPPRKLSC